MPADHPLFQATFTERLPTSSRNSPAAPPTPRRTSEATAPKLARKLIRLLVSLCPTPRLHTCGQRGCIRPGADSIHCQWSEADKQASRLKSNTEAYAKDAKAEALKAVDKFDQKVEEGTAKAKGGISGWFGGSK